MTIVKKTVFVSPDGQFHESEEEAKKYVEHGELVKALRGEIAWYLESDHSSSDPCEDALHITKLLLEKFNITKK